MMGEGSKRSSEEQLSTKGLWMAVGKVVCMGVGIIVSSDFFFWTTGLNAGWKTFLSCVLFVTLGYFFLTFALFELTSAVAFSGGAFGYIRCTLGPFAGFLTACCQLMLYNFFTVCSIHSAARGMHVGLIIDSNWEPTFYLAAYVPVLILQFVDEKYFWWTVIVIAVLTVTIILSVCGIEFFVNSAQWHHQTLIDHHSPSVKGFFDHLCNAMPFFLGIESLTVLSDRTKEPTRVMPLSLMSTFIFAFGISLWLFFTFVVINNGTAADLAAQEFPFNFAFHRTLSLPAYLGPIFTVPSSLCSATCFFHLSQHLLVSMSKSGLANTLFQQTLWVHQVPVYALGTSFITQFAVLMISYLSTRNMPFLYIAITGAAVNYIGILAAYIVFHYKFPSIPRQYRNPFGVVGATIGICIFAVVFFSNAIYATEHMVSQVFFISMFFAGVYYFWVVEKRQFFSEEEQKHFMKAYILNANKRKRVSLLRRCLLTVISLLPVCLQELITSPRRNNRGPSSHHSVGSQSKTSVATGKTTKNGAAASCDGSVAKGLFVNNKVTPVLLEGASCSVQPTASAGSTSLPSDLADKDVEEVRGAQGTLSGKENDNSISSVSPSGKLLRGSVKLAPVTSGKTLAWSGKVLTTRQSQTFFQLLHSNDFLSAPGDVVPMMPTDQPDTGGVSGRSVPPQSSSLAPEPDDSHDLAENGDVLAARLAQMVVQTLPDNFQVVVESAEDVADGAVAWNV